MDAGTYLPKGSADFSIRISQFNGCEHCRETAGSVRKIVNLKLLIYAHSWAPAVGGVEAITRTLAEGLAKCSNSGSCPSIEVTVVTLTAADGMNDSLVPFRVIRRPSIWRLLQLIWSTDILHLAGPALLPLALGRLLKKRTVLEHHNYQSMCPNGLLIHKTDLTVCPGHFLAGRYQECFRCNSQTLGRPGSLLKLLLAFPRRWLAKGATANVAPTCHVKARVALPRTQVIYHGVAHADLSPESLTIPAGGPVCFAFIGRLVKEKGVSDLLRSAHELAAEGYEFRLKIVGDGPERAALEILAEDLGLKKHTVFTGAVSPASVSGVLTEATAVVIPSTWEEVAGLVALEQMIQGRLVIAADVGGLGEAVNGFGFKFPPGDIGALKSCMRQAIENPGLSIRMRHKARANAITSFSQERMVDEHFQLYRRIMEPGALPRNDGSTFDHNNPQKECE
jgi:glycogen(starch) synthase